QTPRSSSFPRSRSSRAHPGTNALPCYWYRNAPPSAEPTASASSSLLPYSSFRNKKKSGLVYTALVLCARFFKGKSHFFLSGWQSDRKGRTHFGPVDLPVFR